MVYKKYLKYLTFSNLHNTILLVIKLKKEKINKLIKIIQEPIHGIEFYTKERLSMLFNELVNFKNSNIVNSQMNNLEKAHTISNYIKLNVRFRRPYLAYLYGVATRFDNSELQYRTAYAALCKKEAMCAGYTEAVRLLLSLYDIDSYTILSYRNGLPMFHYLAITKEKNNQYVILDPESAQYYETKHISYEKYFQDMNFILPTADFWNNKISTSGLGPIPKNFIETKHPFSVVGHKNIHKIINEIEKKNQLEL